MDSTILSKILQSEPNTYVIFYKPTCPYCMRALHALRESNANYKGYYINKNKIGSTDILLKIFNDNKTKINFNPDHTTIPLIFYNLVSDSL